MSESNEGPGESLMALGAIKTRADFEAAQKNGQILAVESRVKTPESIELPARKQPEELVASERRVPVEASAETGDHSVMVKTQVLPSAEVETKVLPQQTEELVLSPVKGEEIAPVTEAKAEVKEPARAPVGEVMLAKVSSKALARELVNRIVRHLMKA